MLRANITLYAVRDASQGEPFFLNVERFLKEKRETTKAYHFRHRRVGFQRSSPQNNFRRIIAAPIDRGQFCFDTVSYVKGMSRALLKLSGSLVHDYATISDDSPSPNRASRARRAATSAGIS